MVIIIIKGKRVGPKMALAAYLVKQTPGRKMYFYAKQVHVACRNGWDNSLGYDPIHRAVKAGLIVLREGRVYPPQRGNQERGAGR